MLQTRNDGLVPGQTFARKIVVTLCVAVCLLAAGCRHKQTLPLLPAIVAASVTPPPTPDAPTMKAPPPATLSDAPPVKVTVAKPKPRTRKKPAASALAQANPPAAGITVPNGADGAVPIAPSATISTLGELSAQSELSPKSQQEAGDLVAAGERRLEALLKTNAGQQQEQIREIRHFLQEARQALATGDAEGGRTLATKAKLLMDDLEKWNAQ